MQQHPYICKFPVAQKMISTPEATTHVCLMSSCVVWLYAVEPTFQAYRTQYSKNMRLRTYSGIHLKFFIPDNTAVHSCLFFRQYMYIKFVLRLFNLRLILHFLGLLKLGYKGNIESTQVKLKLTKSISDA